MLGRLWRMNALTAQLPWMIPLSIYVGAAMIDAMLSGIFGMYEHPGRNLIQVHRIEICYIQAAALLACTFLTPKLLKRRWRKLVQLSGVPQRFADQARLAGAITVSLVPGGLVVGIPATIALVIAAIDFFFPNWWR